MGVYIKGMEMQTNCGVCRFGFAGTCGVHNIEERPDSESIISNDVIGINGARDPDCPLVYVPWHDLVFSSVEIKQHLADIIADFPTIIPASEEGET